MQTDLGSVSSANEKTSPISSNTHTHFFFFWRGWRWWAAKIQAPRGANYHIEEICLALQEDNVRHETHTGSHMHANWRAQMHIVMLEYKRVRNTCAYAQTLKTSCLLTYNHTSGWLSAQVQRTERTRDRRNVAHFPNNLLRLDRLDIHTHRKSTVYQFMQSLWAKLPSVASFRIVVKISTEKKICARNAAAFPWDRIHIRRTKFTY